MDPRTDQALDRWLAAARDQLARREPPPWSEGELRARIDERLALQAVAGSRPAMRPRAQPRAASAKRRLLGWLGARAMAAGAFALLLVAGTLLRAGGGSAALPPAPFIALTSIDAIAAEPGKVVVPARVPRAQLADYGLPVDPARADVPAQAEFLLSARGVVLAVRFVE
jgi:hypothetical protein